MYKYRKQIKISSNPYEKADNPKIYGYRKKQKTGLYGTKRKTGGKKRKSSEILEKSFDSLNLSRVEDDNIINSNLLF